jgi:hypothetical protein
VSGEDDERSGQPSTSKTIENIEKIREPIHEDCHQMIHEIADSVGISYGFLPGDLNRKSEHAPHCPKVYSPTLHK